MKKNETCFLYAVLLKRKLLLKMKLTLIGLLLCLMQVSATVYSQTTLFSFDLNQKQVVNVLQEIEANSNFRFFYQREQVNVERVVSVRANDNTVEDILDVVFAGEGIKYQVLENNLILLSPVNADFSKILDTQQERVTGKVTDESGKALPGVTVVIKGTTNGTVTNIDGNYSLSNVPNNAILVFSFVGMRTQEIAVGNQTSINVTMAADAIGIEEVVAVGYATVTKKELTGSVVSIKTDAMEERPVSNFAEVLQGNASGVSINSTSGAPGSDVQVRIRGIGSINSSVDPLYVVDGLPFTGSLNSINPNDIASIEILKDASSTAIYGSRGANGVILITTKKGSAKKLVVEYNGTYGIQQLRKKIELLNATQYAELANEAELAIGNPIRYSDSDIASFHNGGEGTDWQNEIYQTAPIQNHQLSASGGNNKVKFFISGNYLNQEGIIKTSEFERYSSRVNLDANISDKISIGNTLTVSHQLNSGVSSSGTRSNSGNSNVVWAALITNPTLEIKDEDGNYIENTPDPITGNPVALLDGYVNDTKATNVLGSIYMQYQIVDWLSAKSTFGFGLRNSTSGTYIKSFLVGSNDGRASRSATQSSNWVSTTQLNFDKDINEIQKIKGNLIFEAQEVASEYFSASSEGYVLDNLLYNSLGSASTILTPSSGSSKWSLASFVGRVNYSLKDKYYVTLTGRYDGASRLAAGNKWNLFPSGALSWRASDEPFMSNISAVDDLKFRISYGESGNQSVSVYSTLNKLTDDTAIIGENEDINTGYAPANFPNQDLTWEISKQFDAGFNLSVWNRKIALDFDYFNRTTEGLFFDRELPAIVGTSSLTTTTNIGSVRNSGIEVELEANLINTADFKWRAIGNFTYTRNKVIALAENDVIYTGYSGEFGESSESQILEVGGQLGVFRGWLTDGLYDDNVSLTIDGQTREPGDIKYKDMDGDGDITDDDRVKLGNAIPDFFWGLKNSFEYKGLSLDLFFQGSHGNKIANLNKNTYLLSLDGKANDEISALDRWTESNTDTNIPRATASRPSMKFSDQWLEDGSYIRLKTVTVGYSFPSSNFLSSLKISSLRAYFTGTNLLTFSDYTGYDPDVTRSSSVTSQGYDVGIYPHSKSYVFGINVSF